MASQMVEDTVKKMDQAMARLQEIQCTVAGGAKVCGGIILSPRSTRGYLRTSLRCKEESLRMRELAKKVVGESNPEGGHCEGTSGSARFYGELRRSCSMGEWRRWSMPAVLIQQSVGEILEVSNAAKEAAYLMSNSLENKPVEFPETPQSSSNEKHIYLQGNQGSDCRHVLDDTEMPCLDTGGKAWLQKTSSSKPGKIICKIRMMVREASSTLKNRRKAKKQELSAKARAEMPQAGMRVRRQMNFKASDQAKERESSEETLSSKFDLHCCSPSGTVDQDTCSSETLMKVGQIKPAHKSWISHARSAKAIMFPNPAFVSPPWNHWNKSPKLRSMGSSTRRNLSSSVKDLGFSRTTEPSPSLCKEKGPSAGNEETVLKLIKSSSLSEAYEPNASKLTRQLSVPMVFDRTMKQSHVINVSATSIANGDPPSMSINHKVALKLDNISSPVKVKSSKHLLPSKSKGGLGTMHSISGCSLPAINEISMLSEGPVESQPQPVLSVWPSKNKKNSSPIDLKSCPKIDLVRKSVVLKGAVEEQLGAVPCEGRQRNRQLQITETVNKETSTLMENYSFGSSALKPVAISANEMPYQGGVLERSCSLRYPNQRLLRPIDINCDANSFGKSNCNIDASEERLTKDTLHLKNTNKSKEKENDVEAQKSNSFLQRSGSLRHNNITLFDDAKHNKRSEGNLSFLKHVKGWMSL